MLCLSFWPANGVSFGLVRRHLPVGSASGRMRLHPRPPEGQGKGSLSVVRGTGPHQLKHIERTRVAYKQGASRIIIINNVINSTHKIPRDHAHKIPRGQCTQDHRRHNTQTSDSRLYYYTLPSSRLLHQSDFIPSGARTSASRSEDLPLGEVLLGASGRIYLATLGVFTFRGVTSFTGR